MGKKETELYTAEQEGGKNIHVPLRLTHDVIHKKFLYRSVKLFVNPHRMQEAISIKKQEWGVRIVWE